MQLDDRSVLINDGFPKARQHVLVMPRCPDLTDVTALTAEHFPLLDHLEVTLCSLNRTS